MGVTEEAGKVGAAAVGAMSSQPLAIALLVVNIGFLAFAGYLLGQVAVNAQERNKGQMALIGQLAEDLRNCVPVSPKPMQFPLPGEYPPSVLDIDVKP
jgi:hypothetical protein